MSSWIHLGLKQSVSCRELMGVIGTSELGPPPRLARRWRDTLQVGGWGDFRAAGAL